MIWREPAAATKLLMLLLASACEVWWAIGLMYRTDGSRGIPTDVYAAMVLSIVLLRAGMDGIPIGTVYAVWTGLGTIGTAAIGIFCFHESGAPLRLVWIGLIFAGIVGLGCCADQLSE